MAPPDLSQVPAWDHGLVLEYDAFLNTLTFNSKDIINALTRVAHENKKDAPAICYAIESSILRHHGDRKLPLVYLLDSVVKNVRSPYLDLFAPRIGIILCEAYKASSVEIRVKLRRLLGTWVPYFGAQSVQALQAQLDQIDNMVVSSGAGAVQHMGSSQVAILLEQDVRRKLEELNRYTQHGMPIPDEKRTSCQASIEALINLENNPAKKQALAALLAQVLSGQPQPAVASNAPLPMVAPGYFALPQQMQIGHHHPAAAVMAAPVPLQHQPQQQQQAMHAGMDGTEPTSHKGKKASAAAVSKPPKQSACTSFGALKSTSPDGAVYALYDKLSHVSKPDGARFASKEMLRAHLDWLFQYNKMKKERKNSAAASRPWFARVDDWQLNLKEVSMSDADVAAIFNQQARGTGDAGSQQQSVASQQLTAVGEARNELEQLEVGDGDEACVVCGEKFDTEWNDEREAWMLQDAVRLSDSAELSICHPKCLTSSGATGSKHQLEAAADATLPSKRRRS
ncbi:Polyadenylation and cleavage factor-like 4 [Porphyridium purpureum]|uniref:Polyadenylation and cleavage factor-like 4 n=1 Tax=Porphyridium purpureum TaxID=35688 RepID=A0A5J4Z1Z6_PORPP|nr:Polyadenylation and cleavage factor-like 4 [Porphyridium purpureum]|eukprot:POR9797..scf208_2